MKHSEMTKWEIRKHYVKKASLAICDADMRFYLDYAGFIQETELLDLPDITPTNPLRELK